MLEAGVQGWAGVPRVEVSAVERVDDWPGSGSVPCLGVFIHSPDVTCGPDGVSVSVLCSEMSEIFCGTKWRGSNSSNGQKQWDHNPAFNITLGSKIFWGYNCVRQF